MADTKDIEDRLTGLEKKYERWFATNQKYADKLKVDRQRRWTDALKRMKTVSNTLDSLETELKKSSGTNEDVYRGIRKTLKQINKELDGLPSV